MVSTGNLNTTQQEAIDHLAAHGVRVVGSPTSDPASTTRYLREVLARGAAISARQRRRPLRPLARGSPTRGCVGGTEETTSGRMRLAPLRDRIRRAACS